MRFRVEQVFEASRDIVIGALTNSDYLVTAMGQLPDLAPPVVRAQVRTGASVRQQLEFLFQGRLPSAVTAVIDPRRLSWIEDTTIDMTALAARFTMTPVHYRTFFTCSGTWALKAISPTSTQRVIDGDLKVRSPVPFVGGQVEKAIVSGLKDRLAKEPAVFATWLASQA